MSLSKPHAWIAGTVVVCLLLTLATYFLLIGPKSAQAAELRDETATTQQANEQLKLKVDELKAQFAELPQRQAELAAIRQALPESSQLQTLTRELEKRAESTGVTLMTLSPGAAVPLLAPVPVAPTPAPAIEGEAAAPVATATAQPVATSTLVSIPVTLTVVGTFESSEAFVLAVQTELVRDFLITTLNVVAEQKAAGASGGKPAVKNGDVNISMTGTVFVLRPPAEVVPVPTASPPSITTP